MLVITDLCTEGSPLLSTGRLEVRVNYKTGAVEQFEIRLQEGLSAAQELEPVPLAL